MRNSDKFMELFVKELSSENMGDCINLFINVFNSAPWNDEWTYTKAKELFDDFSKTPGFIGFIGAINEKTIAVCLGHIKKWWNSSEYYIEEYFISPDLQHKGLGTAFLHNIETILLKREIKKITLLTAHNTPSENFYQKNGFNNLDFMTFMKKDI